MEDCEFFRLEDLDEFIDITARARGDPEVVIIEVVRDEDGVSIFID